MPRRSTKNTTIACWRSSPLPCVTWVTLRLRRVQFFGQNRATFSPTLGLFLTDPVNRILVQLSRAVADEKRRGVLLRDVKPTQRTTNKLSRARPAVHTNRLRSRRSRPASRHACIQGHGDRRAKGHRCVLRRIRVDDHKERAERRRVWELPERAPRGLLGRHRDPTRQVSRLARFGVW